MNIGERYLLDKSEVFTVVEIVPSVGANKITLQREFLLYDEAGKEHLAYARVSFHDDNESEIRDRLDGPIQ